MRLSIIFICAAAMVAAIAGCGGGGAADSAAKATGADSSANAASSPPDTKAEFIKRGDTICAKVPKNYREMLSALEKKNKAKKEETPKDEATLKAEVPPLHTAVKEFEELGSPSGGEHEAEQIIASLETAAAGLEAKPGSELAGPKSPFAEFQKLTKEYGFKLCSAL
jgi:hypothetical protein